MAKNKVGIVLVVRARYMVQTGGLFSHQIAPNNDPYRRAFQEAADVGYLGLVSRNLLLDQSIAGFDPILPSGAKFV